MKVTWIALLCSLAFVTGLLAQNTTTDREIYGAALRAEKGRDYTAALKYYQILLKKYPRDPRLHAGVARNKLALREGRPAATLEAHLRKVIIPSVEFDEADLDSVFHYISRKVAEVSGGKVKANFIYRGSSEDRRNSRVSLKLSNVPATELIRYVGEVSRTRFKYERYAVVGTPLRDLLQQPEDSNPLEPA